jgi:hypothetical protein
MAIGGAALAFCGADEDTNSEADDAYFNARESRERRERSCSRLTGSSDDTLKAVSEAHGLVDCILLAEQKFVVDNNLMLSLAVNASAPTKKHTKRHTGTHENVVAGLLMVSTAVVAACSGWLGRCCAANEDERTL